MKLNVLPSLQAQALTILKAVGCTAKLPPAFIARASGTIYVALLLPDDAVDVFAEPLALLTQEIFSRQPRFPAVCSTYDQARPRYHPKLTPQFRSSPRAPRKIRL